MELLILRSFFLELLDVQKFFLKLGNLHILQDKLQYVCERLVTLVLKLFSRSICMSQ